MKSFAQKVQRFLVSEDGPTAFKKLFRHLVDRRQRKELKIDVVGSCNLRCPSCPVGNIGYVNATSLIDVDLFTAIVDKANDDYWLYAVTLYNWGEPFLHPQLPRLVEIVRSRGLPCLLSSNLNLLRNEEAVMRAEPSMLRVSVSGFTQEVYGKTHARGDIEKVKANMVRLSEVLNREGNTKTKVDVYYHKYLHNQHEEEPMRAFATKLGFRFEAVWAYYMGYENLLEVADGSLPEEKQRFVDEQFALPIGKAVEAAKAFKDAPCTLLDHQLLVGLDGSLYLCCTIYEQANHNLGSYLEMTPAQVNEARSDLDVCGTCSSHGLHKYFTYHDDPALTQEFQRLTEENLAAAPEREASVPAPPAAKELPLANGC